MNPRTSFIGLENLSNSSHRHAPSSGRTAREALRLHRLDFRPVSHSWPEKQSLFHWSKIMVRGKTFHFRLRLANGSIINTSQWAHDIFQAQSMLQKRYPGCVVMQVVNE